MSRMNNWFVPGDGIAREVITADIQRYLGPDATVRPGTGTGEYEGRPGYVITAYRTLTSQMIQDLKHDSTRWQAEKKTREQGGHGGRGSPYLRETKVSSRHPDSSLVAYQDSDVHRRRHDYGPSENYAPQSQPPQYPSYTYGGSEQPHYTTTPAATYGTTHQHQAYQAPPSHPPQSQPRTDPYTYPHQQPAPREYTYATTTTPSYSYSPQTQTDPYSRPATTPQYNAYPQQSTVAAPGYYIASDGRQYPLASQPQPQQQPQQPPQAGRRRGAN